MLQHNPQDLDCSKYKCEIHECEILFLCFGNIPKLKSRMLCAKCVIGVVNGDPVQPSLVYLKDFLINPGNQIIKVTRVDGSLIRANESQQIEEMEQLLIKLEDTVKQQVGLIRQNLIKLKAQFGQIAEDIAQNMKLNDIVKELQLLKQMDSYQGSNELVQLEQKLNYISENQNKIYTGFKDSAKDTQALFCGKFLQKYSFIIRSFKIIQNDLEMISKTSLGMLQNILSLGMPAIVFEDIGQFQEIHQLISQGKLIQYELLYQGTRDGMNAQAYWAKCNQQSKLLTIMTSQNGYKFGGYSPCLTNVASSSYVQDHTMKSFLFQYNKKEIYKLKHQYAIYCQSSYGPYYGQGDLVISTDFSEGQSTQLGTSYDISGYNNIDKQSHIFGAPKPQLQEIKVYKVIF